MKKNVLLIGATGYVGTALLDELVNRGHHVTAVVRRAGALGEREGVEAVVADVTDVDAITRLAKDKDAVISAYNPGWGNPRQYEETLETYPLILKAVKKSGTERLLIVGGAGTLFVKPGLRLMDTGTLPEAWLPGVKSMGKFYLETLVDENDIDWVFLSPAANLGNLQKGTRTGKYRVGKDDLLVDAEGNSFISVGDYAVAMIDELEIPKHHKERFCVAY